MVETSIRVTWPRGGVPVVDAGSLGRSRTVTATSPGGGRGTSGTTVAFSPAGTQPRSTRSAGPAAVTNGTSTWKPIWPSSGRLRTSRVWSGS